MNIFVTDSDPVVSAQNLDDKRLIKAILETAQILSSALHNLGYWRSFLYHPTHLGHPCVLWVAKARGNFNWLVLHGLGLNEEYKYRFGNNTHKSTSVILSCAEVFKNCRLDEFGMTPWANCTPFNSRDSTINRYRKYLSEVKWKDTPPRFTKRKPPKWANLKEVA
jgi:hypothetical protein